MPKSPDERIETLEKKVGMYRILITLLVVLLVIVERKSIVNWIDGAQGWLNNVASTRSS